LRWEQFRQARRIHGGAAGLCAAWLGVRLARVPIPSSRLRQRLFRRLYGGKYAALDESELERPLAEFRSLNELFTRGVRATHRPSPDGKTAFLCPCDGTVQDFGRLDEHRVLTVKGVAYRLAELCPGIDVRPFRQGIYAIIFLSPADCHRVFSPAEGRLVEALHVPGRRLLVHPPYQRPEFPVFSLNERVVLRMERPQGDYLLVLVAGWGVGHITSPLPIDWQRSRKRISAARMPTPLQVDRGQWIATFELGSTVIVAVPPSDAEKPLLQVGQRVQFHQALLTTPEAQRPPTGG
jgi:phosphatidylserine decarboxylase